MKNPMRNFFARVLWDPQVDKESVLVRFSSRGAPGGYEEFKGSDITSVGRDGLLVAVGSREKYIPFHRILEIRYRDKEGKLIFSRELGLYDFRL